MCFHIMLRLVLSMSCVTVMMTWASARPSLAIYYCYCAILLNSKKICFYSLNKILITVKILCGDEKTGLAK
jgi:hypothetical protein